MHAYGKFEPRNSHQDFSLSLLLSPKTHARNCCVQNSVVTHRSPAGVFNLRGSVTHSALAERIRSFLSRLARSFKSLSSRSLVRHLLSRSRTSFVQKSHTQLCRQLLESLRRVHPASCPMQQLKNREISLRTTHAVCLSYSCWVLQWFAQEVDHLPVIIVGALNKCLE